MSVITTKLVRQAVFTLPVDIDNLHYQFNHVYDWYDEPLLYSVKTISNDYYLVHKYADYDYVDDQHEIDWQIAFPITAKELTLLENNKLTLNDLYRNTNNKQYYLFQNQLDYSNPEQIKSNLTCYLINVANSKPGWWIEQDLNILLHQ